MGVQSNEAVMIAFLAWAGMLSDKNVSMNQLMERGWPLEDQRASKMAVSRRLICFCAMV